MASKFEHNSWYASPKIVIFLKSKILGEGAKFVLVNSIHIYKISEVIPEQGESYIAGSGILAQCLEEHIAGNFLCRNHLSDFYTFQSAVIILLFPCEHGCHCVLSLWQLPRYPIDSHGHAVTWTIDSPQLVFWNSSKGGVATCESRYPLDIVIIWWCGGIRWWLKLYNLMVSIQQLRRWQLGVQ